MPGTVAVSAGRLASPACLNIPTLVALSCTASGHKLLTLKIVYVRGGKAFYFNFFCPGFGKCVILFFAACRKANCNPKQVSAFAQSLLSLLVFPACIRVFFMLEPRCKTLCLLTHFIPRVLDGALEIVPDFTGVLSQILEFVADDHPLVRY